MKKAVFFSLLLMFLLLLSAAGCGRQEDASDTLQIRPLEQSLFVEEEGEQTYVLNTNSHRFHMPDCPGVQSMKPSNREDYTGTREELIAMGYVPCGTCNP